MFSRILKVFRAEKKPEKQIQRPPRLVRDITMGKSDFDMIEKLATGAITSDPEGYKKEYLMLVAKAKTQIKN